MKAVKSFKWYNNQIAVRQNAVNELSKQIEDKWAACGTQDYDDQCARNRPIQQRIGLIYKELRELREECDLYYHELKYN